MVSDTLGKVNSWLAEHKEDLFIAALIFFTGMAGFGLGRLSAVWPVKEPITVMENYELRSKNYGTKSTASVVRNPTPVIRNSQGQFVASKNGTAYHYPWCPGAQKIKEENKVWFQSREEAEAKGYKPAGNCEGL